MNTFERIQAVSPDLSHEALTMAFAILVDRIRGLPQEDRQDLFELTKEMVKAESQEEIESVVIAIREILEQAPLRDRKMEQPPNGPPSGAGMKKWVDYVSERIRTFRTKAGLTQAQLAEQSGLPQSHISRLENGQHSPSRVTIEKIAKALDQPPSVFDPSA